MVSLEGMRSRVVSSRDMKEKFGAEVRGFRYAFVMPTHGEGWQDHALVPAEAVPPQAPAPARAAQVSDDGSSAPRRRAGDRQPTYIEVKPRA